MAFEKNEYWSKRKLPPAERRELRRESKLRTIQVVMCKRCRSRSGTLVNKRWLCNDCPGMPG